MHPLIRRVLEYKQHYIDQNDGQHPKIPFIVFESEWDQFIQDPNVQRSLAEAKVKDPTTTTIAGMKLQIIKDI